MRLRRAGPSSSHRLPAAEAWPTCTTPSASCPVRFTTTRLNASSAVQVQATSASALALSGQPVTSQRAHTPSRTRRAAAHRSRYQSARAASSGSSAPAPEEHRDEDLPAVGLAVVPERQARQRRDGDRRGLDALRRAERPSGARFVVVLQEPDETPLVRRVGVEVPAHRARRRPAPTGRRAACRSSSRSPAAAGPTPGPSTPPRRTGTPGSPGVPRRSSRSSTSPPAGGPTRSPHVAVTTSSSISMAMSQRTASACSAIRLSAWTARLRRLGAKASTCTTSGQGAK